MSWSSRQTLIFTRNWIVEKISPQFEQQKVVLDHPDQMIFGWFSDSPCALSVGQILKVEDLSNLSLFLRSSLTTEEQMDYKSRTQEFKEKDARRKTLLSDFSKIYKTIDLSKTREVIKNLEEDKEVYYRVFYNSLKMYRQQRYIINLSQELIRLTGHVPEKEIPALLLQFKSLNFDNVLYRALEKTLPLQFHPGSNNPKIWAEEAIALTGTFKLFLEASIFMCNFIEKLQQKTSFLDHQGFLDWDEAGAMEVWTVLGLLRNNGDEYKALFKT